MKYRKCSFLRGHQGCQHAWVVPVEYQGFGSFRLAWAEILLRMGWHRISLCLFSVEICSRLISPATSLSWHLHRRSLTLLATGGGKCWHPALDNLFEPLSLSKKAISLIFLLAFEEGKRYFPHTLTAFSLPFPEILMISLLKVSCISQPINRVRREVRRRICSTGTL